MFYHYEYHFYDIILSSEGQMFPKNTSNHFLPFGIFCSSLKTGLFCTMCRTLKKCLDGGKGEAAISFSFSWCRTESSCLSAAVSSTLPPTCWDMSCFSISSLWWGSGIGLHSLIHSNIRTVRAVMLGRLLMLVQRSWDGERVIFPFLLVFKMGFVCTFAQLF